MVRRRESDQPFDQLCTVRARVRREAAELLARTSPATAVEHMLAEVRRLHVREPPFVGFDAAMLDYTAARTWQWCARQVDPEIVEIQRRWQ